MTDILLIDTKFDTCTTLADLLQRRRVATAVQSVSDGQTAKTLIVSDHYEKSIGGQKALVEGARKCGVQRLIVISENAVAYSETSELGGRLLRVSLPPLHKDVLSNGALLSFVDQIASDLAPMVAADQKTGQLIDMAKRVARTDVTVFVNGPTGSGKEVMARLVHMNSPRADKPFVAINCAAIPENMLEAILFGHEKGSFTGAAAANKGIVRAADGGTLFLDEVTEMPMGLQSKLLRVLQEKTVTPLGSQKEEKVDIRVIATSNRDMLDAVQAGQFREDLYYRLNVFPLQTYALKDRADDIAVLAAAMVRRHAMTGQAHMHLGSDALNMLRTYDWPGNVRELENVIQRALVLAEGPVIQASDIMLNNTPPAAAMLAQHPQLMTAATA